MTASAYSFAAHILPFHLSRLGRILERNLLEKFTHKKGNHRQIRYLQDIKLLLIFPEVNTGLVNFESCFY